MGHDLDCIDTCTHVLVCFPYRLRRVLSDSKEEVEGLVKNYKSPAKLASFVVAMKRLTLYYSINLSSLVLRAWEWGYSLSGYTYQEVQSESKKGTLLPSLCPRPRW